MTTSDGRSQNQQVIDQFRSNHGEMTSGRYQGRALLLLTTTGAKSGLQRTFPLSYTQDGDRYVVIASKGGSPINPDWYHNLVAHPVVTVEVGDETFQARASTTEGAERERLYEAHATARPVFAEYRERTSRVIPVIILERLT